MKSLHFPGTGRPGKIGIGGGEVGSATARVLRAKIARLWNFILPNVSSLVMEEDAKLSRDSL